MKKVFGIVALCAIAASAIAVPARRDGMVRTMADGTEKTIYLNGDEHFHYLTDAEGNMIIIPGNLEEIELDISVC